MSSLPAYRITIKLKTITELGRMPTVLRVGPYRFYFYNHEPNEPPPIHIDRDSPSAELWLIYVSLASNIGFSAKELRKLQSLVQANQQQLLEAWYGYFGS